ncbi:DUF302 domain-containing protein [Aquimarina sp. MMG015]|uniref:DUF302 domain-containing protein n=1 Tax=Aquimarina sp. MMG015 TaxID=2822689 RepID=UPI001B3A4785|nr:DUF302 domain-containing protein [Aquimarina sp. MMG015]MBQ4803081.1 DUF302 domain-containing protein [Aquimarina sp. MMG015]
MKRIVFCFVFYILLFSCNQVKKDTSNSAQPELEKQMEITPKQGIITKQSTNSFDDTYNKLVTIIEDNPNLKIIAQLDHQANAASVGLELNPTRIIMFGNPKLGTPLMQSAQTTGLDLPQKILVFQDDSGTVKISYNDPKYLQQRHDILDKEEVLNKISGALDKITSAAAGL